MEDTDVNRTIQQQPMSPDFYDNFSKGGFDVDYKTIPTQTSIDPYQKYTGVAPPAFLEKSAIPSPEMNLKPLETIPLPVLEEPEGLESLSPEQIKLQAQGAAMQGIFLMKEEILIDPLIKEAKGFIMGETSDDTVVKRFIEKC